MPGVSFSHKAGIPLVRGSKSFFSINKAECLFEEKHNRMSGRVGPIGKAMKNSVEN